MFNNAKLNKNQSLGVLYSLKSILRIGHSLPNALKLLAQVEKGAVQKALEKVVHLIFENNVYPEEALEKFKIISRTEVHIIKNSTDAKEALHNIIEMREVSSRFEKSMASLLGFPVVAVVIGLIIAYAAQPTFFNMVNTLVKQVEVTKGVDISHEVDLMWYLQDRNFDMILLIVYVSVVFALIATYVYLNEHKPNVIYKIFNLKAYDDVPFILMMMYNLNRSGLDPKRIFGILSNTSPKKGWISLFNALEQKSIQGERLYEVFDAYGFPKDIIIILKSSEIGRTFWDNMESLIGYVKETNDHKNDMIKKLYGNVSTIVGYSIVIYFTVGLFMAMFSLQSISTSLM
jgi:type II secretory pathway component PulF